MSATILTYSKLITANIASQAVNLAESGIMGHRVQCPMSVDDLNRFFIWQRPAGSPAPVGHFQQIDASGVNFNDLMLSSLGKTYTDIDGVTNGLNFSSSVLDANTDSRIRLNDKVSANDICMAYMLYKCYGSSAAPTMNVVYNLEDAQEMLTSGTLVLAIDSSLAAEEALSNSPGVAKGAVHAMFTDLLAADPTRFFTAAGIQIPGLFEVSCDKSASGPWGFVENDKIEMRVQFTFTNAVTRSGVQDPSQSVANAANTQDTSTIVIPAGSTFTIRLQITATDTPSGAATKAASSATAQAIADAQQQAAANQAASNAVAAAAAAQNAVNAAMTQKSNADAQVERTIATNAAQATAVSNAEAALQAAQAALAAARASGNQANIQQQNAAAQAAQAAVANAQAIAAQAAAAVQNARTAQANALQALNSAQTAASIAAANVANANAAAAAAAKKTAEDSAAAAAAAAAAATAASDPSTSALTVAQKVVLDPQTVATAQARANASTQIRKEAQIASTTATGAAQTASDTLRSDSAKLALLIAQGGTLADIQIARANVINNTVAQANAQAQANASSTTLINAANAELADQTASATASAQRFALLSTIANAQVNTSTRAKNAAQTTATNTSNALTAAQTAANTATTALNVAVAGGAVMTEVQTLTAKSLAANQALATATSVNNAAQAALTAAQARLADDTKAAAAALEDITRDAVVSAQAAAMINIQLTLATNYQNNVAFLATVNQQSQQLNRAQIALNTARVNKHAAISAYSVAKNALDAATTAGGTVPTLVALQQKAQAAADAEIQAIGVWNAATVTYDTILSTIQASSQKAVLLLSEAQQQMNADQITLTSASAAAAAAASTLDTAKTAAAAAVAALAAAVTSGTASASTLSSLTTDAEIANQAVVNATLADKSAKTYLVAAQSSFDTNQLLFQRGAYGIVDSSGNSLIDASGNYILTQAATMQLAAIDDATANTLVNKYISLTAAFNTAKAAAVAADNASSAAANALQAAITGGLPLESISALSVTAADAAAKASTANIAANVAETAAINSLGAMYTSPSAASALTILNAMLASQNANSAKAYANQMAAQLNAAYATNTKAQNAVVTATYAKYLAESATNNAVEGGATVAQIQKLQAISQQTANILAKDTHAANQAAAALAQAQGWATLDPNSAAILDLSHVEARKSAKAAAINTLVLNYMNLMAAKDTATSFMNAAQSKYNTDNEALNIAITQGQTIEQIQAARAVVQESSTKLAQAQAALNFAIKSKDAAMNNLTGTDASGNILLDASNNPLVDSSGNSINQAALDILSNALIVQQRAIADAEANVTVRAYTNAFALYQATVTTFEAAQSAVMTANRNLNIAITSGKTVEEIQALREIVLNASVAESKAQTDMTNALAAKDRAYITIASGMTLDASGNPVSDGSGNVLRSTAAMNLLIQTQLAQRAAIANAQSNALARAYMAALEAKAEANITLTNNQHTYDSAAAAMNQAITGGATVPEIQALQLAAQNAGQLVATAQTTANAAAAAVALALQQVNANPNAVAILQQLEIYQANKASLANANKLLNLFYTASKAAVTAANNLALATNAASIATAALDAAINSGADISQIQSLQATANAANISKSNAQAALDSANSQRNQAQSNANSDPVANGINVAAGQFAAIAQAKTALNSANIALSASAAAATAARAAATLAANASLAANALLTSAIQPYDASNNPTGGKTQQEIVLLQQEATTAANTASVTMNASNSAAADVISKQNLVSVATTALAALPTPSVYTTLAYTMTAVRLNETQVSADGLTLYIDSNVLALASTGTTIGSQTYAPVDLSGVQILGTGVSSSNPSPTNIVSYSVVPSVPVGLYPSCVAIVLNNPVTPGDGVFYLVGGEVYLYDFIL